MAFKKIPMLFCLQYAQSYNSILLWHVNHTDGWSDANGKGHLGPVSTSWDWWKQAPKFLSACSFPNPTESPTHLYIGSSWGRCRWTCKHTWKSSFKEEFVTSLKVDPRQKPSHWDLPPASLGSSTNLLHWGLPPALEERQTNHSHGVEEDFTAEVVLLWVAGLPSFLNIVFSEKIMLW